MNMFDEITAHVTDLNWAYYEQEKYRVDAYDQRNGQQWFREASGRVYIEQLWFSQHQLVLGVSREDIAHHFYAIEEDEEEAVLLEILRAEYVLRNSHPTEHWAVYDEVIQLLQKALALSGNLPLQESPAW